MFILKPSWSPGRADPTKVTIVCVHADKQTVATWWVHTKSQEPN